MMTSAGSASGRLHGYPDEERTVAECIAVVMVEEIEHYRFAMRDMAILEARQDRAP